MPNIKKNALKTMDFTKRHTIMDIGFYKLSEIDEKTKQRLMRRSEADIDSVMAQVKPIIENVRQNGNAALLEYTQKFDGATLNNLKVTEEEFDDCLLYTSPSPRDRQKSRMPSSA